jgi:predicted RNase H-like HicB family nuclease
VERAIKVVIEKDAAGYFVVIVPELPGCHSQSRSLDELSKRMKEAIELYLEVQKSEGNKNDIFKEGEMKIIQRAFLFLLVCAAAYAQTEDLGQGVFYNDEGDIIMVVDASLAIVKMNSPYVMFMVFMATRGPNTIQVHRDDVAVVYEGQEYKMPSIQELRKNYNDQRNDHEHYQRIGKDGIIFTKIRFYSFPQDSEFFPVLGPDASPAINTGTLGGNFGFKTKFYFKNPGFKKGDELMLKVKDRKNPEIAGEVGIILK